MGRITSPPGADATIPGGLVWEALDGWAALDGELIIPNCRTGTSNVTAPM
jgi:hypothetical protein